MLHVNWLIGGVVVVEVLFNYPGLGRLLLDAAMRNDITLLMGGTLVLTFVAWPPRCWPISACIS